MNPRLDLLQPYPFERWRQLVAGTEPNAEHSPISLSIGEPRHPAPALIREALTAHLGGLSHYPQTAGSRTLREAIATWAQSRHGLDCLDPDTQVLPTLGSREALFSATQTLLDPDDREGLALCPNPFYQIYEGAILLAGGRPWYVNADPAQGFRITYDAVPAAVWARTRLVFLCSPGNPTGRTLSLEEWRFLFDRVDQFGCVLLSDECYSEIYPDEGHPPLGGLAAARMLGRTDYRGLLVMGSLSKRSNVPGLRSAFVAGDATLLKRFLLYRTYHGSAMSPAVQAASIAAWNDETHVCDNRTAYREKMDLFYQLVNPHWPLERPQAGFYYWAGTPVDDGEFARSLYLNYNLAILPGSLLSRTANGINPGARRVRIALVGSLAETRTAAERMIAFMNRF